MVSKAYKLHFLSLHFFPPFPKTLIFAAWNIRI
jgi:hypothetical protein